MKTKMLITGWMVLAMSMAVNTSAALLFVDTFENGSVTNSDFVSGFWTTAALSLCSVSETSGKVDMLVKPKTNVNQYVISYSQIKPEFNFFTTTLVYNAKFNLAASGIQTADLGKMSFRFLINDIAGANLGNSTNFFDITLYATGTVSVISKVNGGTQNTLKNIAGAPTNLAQELTLRLDSTNYYLDLIYAGGVTTNCTGAHGLSQAAWRTTGSSLQLMTYEACNGLTAASTNGTWTVGVSELTVTAIPEPTTLGLFILSAATMFGVRTAISK